MCAVLEKKSVCYSSTIIKKTLPWLRNSPRSPTGALLHACVVVPKFNQSQILLKSLESGTATVAGQDSPLLLT